MTNDYKYCNSLTTYSRFKTKIVHIGDVPLGGHYPIRVQSMTSTDTLDTEATVQQCFRMIEAGCEYIRLTAQGIKEAENLAKIKKQIRDAGFQTPLIADIHFNPAVAEVAARYVEKVRINPGNYVDKKRVSQTEYSDAEFNEEVEKIRGRIFPLIKICQEYGTVIRIGTNHGSLSDRIVNRYGDTPTGMVEASLEFIRIFEDFNFRQLVLSMKASNTRVMIAAHRLLVHVMMKSGMNYPIHVGVTEAGFGEEGRIKSAAGVGTLLEDGIGDTIRISLTEDPEFEIPVAKTLVNRYHGIQFHNESLPVEISPINPFEYHKHYSRDVLKIGKENVPVIIITGDENKDRQSKADFVFFYGGTHANRFRALNAPAKADYINKSFPLFSPIEYFTSKNKSSSLNFIKVKHNDLTDDLFKIINDDVSVVLVFESEQIRATVDIRSMFIQLINAHCKAPVIIHRKYDKLSPEEFQIYAANDIGLLMTDGLGDGIWLEAEGHDQEMIERTSFNILQATRARIVKTEFISCPSCGRTSFNIFEAVQRVKEYTGHLIGLKIAVMGCVVNGPGEMADADYGYVGAGTGKINLYKGKTVVRRNIPEKEALDSLIDLLKENGDWLEENK